MAIHENVDRRSGTLGRREDDNDIIDETEELDELRVGFAMAIISSMNLLTITDLEKTPEWIWAMADAMLEAR